MLLCDAAQEVGGKLYILGAGWTALQQPDAPASMALGIIFHVDWNETNRRHPVEIELQNADGEVWEAQEGQPLRLATAFEIGRPPGLRPGTELNSPLAATFHGVTLPAGGYVWMLRSETTVLARCPFSVGLPGANPGGQ
jgi:hypothetical protein